MMEHDSRLVLALDFSEVDAFWMAVLAADHGIECEIDGDLGFAFIKGVYGSVAIRC